MSLAVFLGPVTDARVGDVVVVEGDEARHAVVVRRTAVGEQVVLADGAGTAATCTVTATTKSTLTATVDDVRRSDRPTPTVTVVQAIPKGERAELAVEVLTEIGTDRIVPWAAARCVGVWRGERAAKSLAKWRATARESAKQSRRAWLPEVTEMATTAEVADLLAGVDLAVVLHEAATDSLADLPVAEATSIAVVVGPEGGLTDDELAALAPAHVVRTGDPVLRTSTAGVAAVAALLSRTSRWG
ncbi:16S rRNA (uracil1498-N3)-methyltransferase [Nocardioides scoriae]|uniref:Ribosomal RNA small subunit methyltransferase E n=1 Tax=Nocardioides scoriae TaxID=642780 RepID=A0A1H1M4I2_9ACTN|nr:16S rRNA (uracil(1498)-N(3))-methyltransferase [Nocardioides scoriae]SDR80909.1 16S rRNA (uracil1498-N3)-methyltransferase [Nocardioides scoriae]